MSPPELTDKPRGIVVQKPRADIYTALLIVAFVSILIGILMLCLELGRFGWDIKATKVKGRTAYGAPLAEATRLA